MIKQFTLEATNISFEYNTQAFILENISLSVKKGEKILLTGASGSGKTTLLHILGRILQPTQGTVNLFGEYSFIFQANHLLSNCTALENVALPLVIKGNTWDKALSAAKTLLEEVDLMHRADAVPAQLSGGEKQRVSIARALSVKPNIIFCDEPTGNLDDIRTNIVFKLLNNLSKKYNTSILVVSHENDIPMHFDKHYHLLQGKLIEKTLNKIK